MPKASYNSEAIVARIRYLITKMGLRQGSFAARIGIDPGNFSKTLTGVSPVTAGLVNRIVADIGVSKSWLTEGRGLPFDIVPRTETIELDVPVAIGQQRGVPVYDIDVTAGMQELSMMLTDDRIIGHLDLPQLRKDATVVRVSGDSMTPVIKDGAFVAIHPINDTRYIYWGQIYVIVMEDYRMVKYLRRHPSDPGTVILHSANPDYDDMEVSRTDLRRLFYVDAILNYELRF